MEKIKVNDRFFYYRRRRLDTDSNYNQMLEVFETNCPDKCKNMPVCGMSIKDSDDEYVARGNAIHLALEYMIGSNSFVWN